jgi:hypothetical protein
MTGLVRVGIVTLAAVAPTAGPTSAQPKAPGVTGTETVIGHIETMKGIGNFTVPGLMRAQKPADLFHVRVAPSRVFKPLF